MVIQLLQKLLGLLWQVLMCSFLSWDLAVLDGHEPERYANDVCTPV